MDNYLAQNLDFATLDELDPSIGDILPNHAWMHLPCEFSDFLETLEGLSVVIHPESSILGSLALCGPPQPTDIIYSMSERSPLNSAHLKAQISLPR